MPKATSLTTRIARTAIVAVALGIGGGVGLFLYSDMQRSLKADTERLASTASAFASAISDGVAAGDERTILSALRGVRSVKDVVYTAALDTNGRTITEIGTGVQLLAREPGLSDRLTGWLPSGNIRVSADVSNAGRKVGTIIMQAEIGDLRSRYLSMIGLSFLFGAAMILLTVLIVRSQVMRLMRPLNALAGEFKDIGRATDLTRRLSKANEDEVGVLVDAFNEMFGHIARRDDELKRHRDTLEDTVQARTAELKIAKEEAESANAAKSDFLATMSHEIRTPMNGMLVMAEMLAAAPLAPKHLRYAEIISRSGRNLLHIINDILDLSKIESGKIELECIDYAIDDVIGDVACLFAERAREKNLTLAVNVGIDVPARLAGDPTRLAQVVGNLVNNALKFTETGGLTMAVSVGGEQRDRLVLSVRDTGIGMSAEQTARLFQRFAQADSTIARKFGGTGLGLSISRQLVELMGGTIRVESREGEGSCFTVSLPLEAPVPARQSGPKRDLRVLLADTDPVSAPAIASALRQRGVTVLAGDDGGPCSAILVRPGQPLPEGRADGTPVLILRSFADTTATHGPGVRLDGEVPLPLTRQMADRLVMALAGDIAMADLAGTPEAAALPAPADLGHLSVLVVDDVAVNREVLGEALRTFAIAADFAGDGETAVRMAGDRRYDVIFMDCSMPGMDGFEATRAIRSGEAASGRAAALIIALTGHVMNRDSGRWSEEGMDGYLAKPFTIEQLDKVFAGLAGKGGRDAVAAPVVEPAPLPAEAGPSAAEEGLPLLSASSLAMFRMVSASTGTDMMARVFSLYRANAGPALDTALAAIRGGDPQAAKLVHALKSNCSSAGAERATDLCNRIEIMLKQGEQPEPALVSRLEAAIADTMAAMQQMLQGDRAAAS